MVDTSGLFGLMGNDSNITAANIIRSRYRQPIEQAAMENAEPNSSIRNVPDNPFQAWLKESGQRIMNPTDTIAQGVQNFTQQDPVDMGMSLMGGGLGTFAGVRAKTADRASFNIASKMKEAGVADREIHAQTGWTFGFPDGRPRFEIDDSAATGHFTHLPPSTDRLSEKALRHPSIYQAYPELSKISQLGLRESKEAGSFSPTYIDDAYSGGSLLAKAPDETGIKSVGLHELQHAVQQQEGFARGGSPDNFAIGPMFNPKARDMATELSDEITGGGRASMDEIQFGLRSYKGAYGNSVGLKKVNDIAGKYGFTNIDDAISFLKLEDVKRSPFGQYQRLAGEAEARLTQSRMNMTAAERAASYPPSMFDVPVDQQIVRFGDGPAMSTNNQPLVNALRSK